MTTTTPTGEWLRALQSEEFAAERLKQIDDSPNITEEDEGNVRRWARIFMNATEKLGTHALDEAQAKSAALAHVRMRMQVDEEYRDSPLRSAERAFEAGLRLYLKLLAGDVLAVQTGRWARIEIGIPNAPISSETYCPQCAPDQREAETKRGNRWPQPWEASATTGSLTIREREDPPESWVCLACGREA